MFFHFSEVNVKCFIALLLPLSSLSHYVDLIFLTKTRLCLVSSPGFPQETEIICYLAGLMASHNRYVKEEHTQLYYDAKEHLFSYRIIIQQSKQYCTN